MSKTVYFFAREKFLAFEKLQELERGSYKSWRERERKRERGIEADSDSEIEREKLLIFQILT